MRSALSLAAILVASAAFAGCLGGDDGPDVEAAAAAAEQERLAANMTANVTNDDGSAEMATSVGSMPHLHDYWKDRERVTLMDEDITVDGPNAVFWTFFDAVRGTPGIGGAMINLPEGATVYEGTGQLEFTATWTEATVTGMAVSYRSAAENTYTKPVEIKSNTPFVVEVTPEMSDMPHAKTSRWQFLVQPGQAGQAIYGKFHVKVDIVRLRDIEVFPGHPKLFEGAQTLTLFEGTGSSNQANFATRFANAIQQKSDDDGVRSAKVVPMETMSMTGNLTIKSTSSTLGTASRVTLLVKPADRGGYTRVEAIAKDVEKQVYQFAWLVPMTSTDSPYAKESDWKFDVLVDTQQDVGGVNPTVTGLSSVKVDYDLVVVAYAGVVQDAKELRFGGRQGGG